MASSLLLAEVVGPVLGLNVFAGSVVPVPLRPTPLALVVPLAGAAVLAVALLAIDGMSSRRHSSAPRCGRRRLADMPGIDDLIAARQAAAARPAAEPDGEAMIRCDRLVRIFSVAGVETQALQGLDLVVRRAS